MRLSHFAKLEVIVPPSEYTSGGTVTSPILRTVGMAQNVNIDDNFGSRAENTIGSPLPVLSPGYQQTTVTIEKATIDGADFRNLGAFNPLWAHVGLTYKNQLTGGALAAASEISDATSNGMYPFMFVLRVRNKISNSSIKSNITNDNLPGDPTNPANNRGSSFGVYACVLTSATISATSGQAVIMDRISAIARPVAGTWLSDKIKDAFQANGEDTESYRNGMQTLIYDLLYGYIS
jgi:hypothetical protein